MTVIDEALARRRLQALLPRLSDPEVSAALRMIDDTLDLGARETAIQQLVDSSAVGRELVRAFADLCRLFALDDTTAADIN